MVLSAAHAQKISYPASDDSSVVCIKGFYNGYGKIFRDKAEAHRDHFGAELPDPFIEGYYKELKLTEAEILKAEGLLFENYNDVYANDERFNAYDFTVRDPKKHLKYYYRQYLGFTNEKGERMVLIHLMNFKNKKKASQYFRHWDKYFSIGTGDFYGRNQKTFIINLTENDIKLN
jgi:hypothetical protein